MNDNHLSQFFTHETSNVRPNKRYLISAKDEILQAIKKLTKRSKLITMYLEDTNEFVITTLIGIDEKKYCIYIDDVKDYKKRKDILANTTLTITSQSKGIKYLFPVNVIGSTIYENGYAFKVSLPDYVLKLQRREFFRATPPVDHPIKCKIKFDIGNMNINIGDISEGGINLVDRNNALYIKPNAIIKSCLIKLANFGTIESDLKVSRITYSQTDPKKQTRYIGCEYVQPNNMMTSIIRRYIWKVERYSRSSNKKFN